MGPGGSVMSRDGTPGLVHPSQTTGVKTSRPIGRGRGDGRKTDVYR